MTAIALSVALAMCVGCAAHASHHRLAFVDAETGRGIPLVELETMNEVRYVSDSAGLVAIDEPGLYGTELYFKAHSHGYRFEPDAYGFSGVKVQLTPGGSTTFRVTRQNLAERLYRVTGEGIYRDSQLLGEPIPLPEQDQPAGGVFGQDSVVNAIYGGLLYWFWGDTERANYPLGNFEVAGAVSRLPGQGGMDPDRGVELDYFVDGDGFTRPMCPIEGPGPVWIDGLMVVTADDGSERMLCHFARHADLTTVHEHGLAVWNDQKRAFEKHTALPLDAPLYPHGHPLRVREADEVFFYFGSPFPHTRVRARFEDIVDPARYESYTCLAPGARWGEEPPELERNEHGRPVWRWKADTATVTPVQWKALAHWGQVGSERSPVDLVDVETGKPVLAHGGSVAWNGFRQRWVMIALENGGTSPLGEVWYAEAKQPVGPWSLARRIVTHDKYSFYNVKQHPYFATDGGRYLYFEGTYTLSFSGNDRPTPRYDYNQIMYRLDLSHPLLPHLE